MISLALYSSRSEEWATPQGLFDALDREFRFTLDAAASKENAKCARFYSKADRDGLTQPWGSEVVFLNPPYGREIGKWMQRAAEQSSGAKATVVCLIHARTDTKWWHTWVMPYASELRFIRGRVTFAGATNSSPFPSVVVVFRPGGRVENKIPAVSWP